MLSLSLCKAAERKPQLEDQSDGSERVNHDRGRVRVMKNDRDEKL